MGLNEIAILQPYSPGGSTAGRQTFVLFEHFQFALTVAPPGFGVRGTRS